MNSNLPRRKPEPENTREAARLHPVALHGAAEPKPSLLRRTRHPRAPIGRNARSRTQQARCPPTSSPMDPPMPSARLGMAPNLARHASEPRPNRMYDPSSKCHFLPSPQTRLVPGKRNELSGSALRAVLGCATTHQNYPGLADRICRRKYNPCRRLESGSHRPQEMPGLRR